MEIRKVTIENGSRAKLDVLVFRVEAITPGNTFILWQVSTTWTLVCQFFFKIGDYATGDTRQDKTRHDTTRHDTTRTTRQVWEERQTDRKEGRQSTAGGSMIAFEQTDHFEVIRLV
jgi:hypothetical protein